MAVRTWANTLGIAAGTGVLVGAGQLGIVYGLGIVQWDRDFATGAPWHAQLAWLAFLAMVAVIGGALAGAAQARRLRLPPSLALRVALAFAAAIGATVILPLVARPAIQAHLSEPVNPRISALLVVATGLLVGVVAAVGVLAVPAVSGSVIATGLWVWVTGLIAAASTLGSGSAWGTAELGLLSGRGVWIPVTLLLPAVLIALGVAAVARFGGGDLRAVAACGLAGPALVGTAYLIAGPGGGAQTDAYRYALFAIAAGFAVSALVAVVRRRPAPRRTAPPVPEPDTLATAPVSPAPVSPAPVSAAPVSPAPLSSEPEPEPEPEPGRTRFGAADYGWPEPEGTESDATDLRRVELPPPPAAPEPAPKPAARPAPAPAKRTRRKPTPVVEEAPVSPAAAAPVPAPPPAPAPAVQPEPEPEPEPEAKGRTSRRARRQAETGDKPGKAPRVSKTQAREDDHVDWVRSLGGEDSIRVGGVDPARHSKDDEES
jgi:hypothetical protein